MKDIKTVPISLKLLEKMVEYVVDREVILDWGWANCRDLKELIQDEEMPELYFELTNLIKKI
tara:strand:- start:23009 stop:23194 length:186 start_codon:yes stop_codon:yes gene_type:complete